MEEDKSKFLKNLSDLELELRISRANEKALFKEVEYLQ